MSTTTQNKGGLNPKNLVATGELTPQILANTDENGAEKTVPASKTEEAGTITDKMPEDDYALIGAFSKSSKVSRSPPLNATGTPKNVQRNKRRALKSPEIEEAQKSEDKMILDTISEALKIASEMNAVIKETVNTKTEIKKGVDRIYMLMNRLDKNKALIGKPQPNEEEEYVNVTSTGSQTIPVEITTIQTPEEILEEKIKTEVKQITEEIEKRTEDNIVKLITEDWPKNCFTRVNMNTGLPMASAESSIILVTNDPEEKSKLMELMIQRNPDLEIILEEGIEEGESKFIENISRTSTGTTRSRKTHVVRTSSELGLINLLREIIAIDPKDIYKVAATDAHDEEKIRKVLELAGNFENVTIDMYVRKGSKLLKKGYNTVARMPKEKPHVINVSKSDSESPMENIIEAMKVNIKSEEVGVQIKCIKKEKNGNVKIFTTGNNKEETEKLINQIHEKVAGVTAKVEESFKKSIIIRNIDSATNKKEVAEAIIRKIQKGSAAEYETRVNLKPTYRGDSQVAIVRMDQEDIKKIGNSIKIGWVDCIAQEMLTPKQCYNCYSYGHIARECTKQKVEMKGVCRKCGNTDHLERDCQNQAKCRDCGKEGHSSGKMTCPIYRRLVREERQSGRKKTGSQTKKDERKQTTPNNDMDLDEEEEPHAETTN